MAQTLRCVEVALPVPLHRTFTYRVPDTMPAPAPGSRVVVPLRGGHAIGIVLSAATPPEGVTLKAIRELPDAAPAFTPALLSLAAWIASYYAAPIGITLRAMLPSLLAKPHAPAPAPVTYRMVQITASHGAHLTDSLMERERVFARAPQQRALFELLHAQGGAAEAPALLEQAGCSASVLDGLVKKGAVEIRTGTRLRDPFAHRAPIVPPPSPTEAQHAAIQAICSATPGSATLLHGITGSGKTLVYIEVLREIVQRQGRSAIVLVPEIALTPQAVDRFRGAFGDDVAVLHSALSDGERLDAWRLLHAGTRRIVVGARSALFAPLTNVGVIVVDEEHDASYKQGETPRYHARDAALIRARAEGAVVVLGSATPSLETWSRAARGSVHTVTLPKRATGASLPAVEIVDLREQTALAMATRPAHAPYDPMIGVLTPPLRDAMQERLDRREQTVLLLNRRGFASFVECRGCGEASVCPHCSIALTYHRVPESLLCHYCQYRTEVPLACARCGGATLARRGLGTQQVERLVSEVFPDARIARMDVDTTGAKWSHAEILDRVGRGEVDILLGTQMIAKGLDFPNVTLVGVIDADIGLHLPDFRAAERTFQLLSQVAGRSGRSEKPGTVIIQTRRPSHHAVRAAAQHDLHTFMAAELDARRAPAYPPFVHLANIVVRGPDDTRVAASTIDTAAWVRALLARRGMSAVDVVGPAPCPVHRIKDQWRWHFFLRTPSSSLLTRLARYIAEKAPAALDPSVRLIVDRDPTSLL